MLRSIKIEVKESILSGRVFISFVFAFGIYVFFALSSISYLRSSYADFEFSKDQMSLEEFEQILHSPRYNEKGEVNTLLLKREMMEDVLVSLSPENAFIFCEEVGIYMFPLLMTVIGALTIGLDYSSRVMRVRAAREGRWRFFVAKQCVMLFFSAGLTFLSTLLYRCVSNIFFSKAMSLVSPKYINVATQKNGEIGNGILRFLFFTLCIWLFLEIGFCLTYISTSPIVSIVFVGFLWYFNIVPSKYDPQNAVYNIANRLFIHWGAVPNRIVSEISLTASILIIIILLIVPMYVAVFFWKKRSVF